MDIFNSFNELPLAMNLLIFILAAIITWFAGSKLSGYGVVIGDRLNISHSILGFFIVAGATSLPELVITLTGSLKGDTSLVLNNMFGGISMQTATIALADMIAVSAPITYLAFHSSLLLEAVLLILVLSCTLAVIFIKDFVVMGWVGLGALLVSSLYVLCIFILNRYEEDKKWVPIEIPEQEKNKIAKVQGVWLEQKRPIKDLIILFVAFTVVVLFASLLLVSTATHIAAQTGLGSSFIGSTLLAATTSLPELSVTITAVSMGAYSMAISNIFGSNMIMLALVLPAEIFYYKGAILQEADKSAIYAIISGIFLTAIYLTGLLLRDKRTFMQMGIDSILVLVFYLLTFVAFYHFR